MVVLVSREARQVEHDHEVHAAFVQPAVREQVLKLAAIRGLKVVIVLAVRATPGSADIGIGSMDVYRPNIKPVALVAIVAVTAVVGVAAAFVPARWAVRMDPLMALRHA